MRKACSTLSSRYIFDLTSYYRSCGKLQEVGCNKQRTGPMFLSALVPTNGQTCMGVEPAYILIAAHRACTILTTKPGMYGYFGNQTKPRNPSFFLTHSTSIMLIVQSPL